MGFCEKFNDERRKPSSYGEKRGTYGYDSKRYIYKTDYHRIHCCCDIDLFCRRFSCLSYFRSLTAVTTSSSTHVIETTQTPSYQRLGCRARSVRAVCPSDIRLRSFITIIIVVRRPFYHPVRFTRCRRHVYVLAFWPTRTKEPPVHAAAAVRVGFRTCRKRRIRDGRAQKVLNGEGKKTKYIHIGVNGGCTCCINTRRLPHASVVCTRERGDPPVDGHAMRRVLFFVSFIYPLRVNGKLV